PSEDLAPDEENAAEVEDRDEELLVEAGSEKASELRPNRLEEMVARYRESVYGRRAATHAELLVELPLLTGTLRGRIDRLDRLPDGRWEMVDFKSGPASAGAAGYYRRQLALYALALRDGWHIPAGSISAHLFFLQDGTDLEFAFADPELDLIRSQAEASMLAIARGEFPAVSGQERCRRCDYGHLCD
ncbi:MAG: PD-(D/E)XK nuclease family protein, partial [Chloroflexi bacterium]|nr:PD-(D/E)XK nuclease family protein [Chloroflexota bacterium]